VACTDAHLGTAIDSRIAMIVEDDTLGTSSITYGKLADRTSRFAQLLRNLGVAAGDRVLCACPVTTPDRIPRRLQARGDRGPLDALGRE
jgi:acyl-coenzyme A synthetase/AMP-(fatty) acid ligase